MHTGVALGVKVAAVAAGAVVAASAATGFVVGDGVWYGAGGGDGEDVRAGGDAEILAFAAGDNADVLSTEGGGGIAVPEGAVEPGDTLGACEPTYVYGYIRFEGMARETPYSGAMTRSSATGETVPKTWEYPPEFTDAFLVRRGSEPLAYGEWVLAIEIDGVEVDRETFTLEEDCPD